MAGIKEFFRSKVPKLNITVRRLCLYAIAGLAVILFLSSLFLGLKAFRFTYDEPAREHLASWDGKKTVINILLLGSDERLENTGDPGRCDCTMLCSLNLLTGKIKLISFERGISVEVLPGVYEILTHGFHYGGCVKMTELIEKYFDVPVDGYAHVDFDTFTLIANEIGGVEIELTSEEAAALNGETWNSTTYASRRMHEGKNSISGRDLLLYCRLRSTDDNWARQQRQRNAVSAVIRKMSHSSPFTLNSVLNRSLKYINTDLPKGRAFTALFNAPRFLLGGIEQLQVPEKGMNEWGGIAIDFNEQREIIRDFIYG